MLTFYKYYPSDLQNFKLTSNFSKLLRAVKVQHVSIYMVTKLLRMLRYLRKVIVALDKSMV